MDTDTSRKMITRCITFARKFMSLPEDMEAVLEDCPSKRFPTVEKKTEGDGAMLFVNRLWLMAETEAGGAPDAAEYEIFRQLRRTHQQYEVLMGQLGLKNQEKEETLEQWRQELTEGEGPELLLDAAAYAACLCNLFHVEDREPLRFRLPDALAAAVRDREETYYRTRPELYSYVSMLQVSGIEFRSRTPEARKIGRNDPCPCGSGKKFKKCCMGKGIWD